MKGEALKYVNQTIYATNAHIINCYRQPQELSFFVGAIGNA
jgi:hypothetical protein